MSSARLAATLLVWCVATVGAFWLITQGITAAENRVRWYQACEHTLTAQAWVQRRQTCGEFALMR